MKRIDVSFNRQSVSCPFAAMPEQYGITKTNK